MKFKKIIPSALTLLIPLCLNYAAAETMTQPGPKEPPDMLEPIREADAKVVIWRHSWIREQDGFFKQVRQKVCEKSFAARVFDIRDAKDKGFGFGPENSTTCVWRGARGSLEINAHSYILITKSGMQIAETEERDEKLILFGLNVEAPGRSESPQRMLTSQVGVFDLERTELTSSLAPNVYCREFSDCRRENPEYYSAEFYILDEAE